MYLRELATRTYILDFVSFLDPYILYNMLISNLSLPSVSVHVRTSVLHMDVLACILSICMYVGINTLYFLRYFSSYGLCVRVPPTLTYLLVDCVLNTFKNPFIFIGARKESIYLMAAVLCVFKDCSLRTFVHNAVCVGLASVHYNNILYYIHVAKP